MLILNLLDKILENLYINFGSSTLILVALQIILYSYICFNSLIVIKVIIKKYKASEKIDSVSF